MKYTLSAFCLLLSFLATNVFGQEPYVIRPTEKEYHMQKKNIFIYEDSSSRLGFEEVYKRLTQFEEKDYFKDGLDKSRSAYWITFVICDSSNASQKWLLQAPLHSQSFELYIQEENGEISKHLNGQNNYFYDREYQIRAVTFDISPAKGKPVRYFARIKSENHISFDLMVSDQHIYTNILINGYTFLGINYGIVFLMALYNFILYLSVRDKVFIYYILYTISSAFFMTWKDGLGFQYIWYDSPSFNIYHHRIALFMMLIFSMIFSRQFLGKNAYFKQYKNLYFLFTALATVTFILNLFSRDYFDPMPVTYLAAWLFVYGTIIYSLIKGYKPSTYIIIAYTFLLISLITIKLRYLGILEWSWFDEYILNFSTILESVVMSLAIRDKLTNLRKEKESAQEQVIVQLQNNKELSEKVNKELEHKVQERTLALHQKTEELISAKEKLQTTMLYLEEMSSKLDKDNFTLKKTIKNERILRISDNEILSFEEFHELFPNDSACYRYLEELKWGEANVNYQCKKCGNKKFGAGNQAFSRKCSKCNYIETVTSNTLFHGIKFPIDKAFYITYITLRKDNISSDELSESLDLRRDTCWKFKKKVIEKRDVMKVKLKAGSIYNLDQVIPD